MRLVFSSFLWAAAWTVAKTNGFAAPQIPLHWVTRTRRSCNRVIQRRNPASGGMVINQLFSSAPSDTSSEESDFSEFGYGTSSSSSEMEKDIAIGSESLVNKVLDSLPTDFSSEVSPSMQATINEILYTLEALNPTKNPAMSPMVNGVWELRYSGGYADDFALQSPTRQLALFLYSGGYSPGLFCYRLAQTLPKQLFDSDSPLTITIRRDQPRVEASLSVKILNGAIDSQVSVKAKLESVSAIRLRETYESITVMDREQTIPSQLQYARDLYVTYVDEDLLVVRDASGVPEILVRQEKRFQRNWGVEPSAISDMEPPGAGEDAKF